MEQSICLQRQRTNVDFVDENGQSFAGLYVLEGSTLTVSEVLGMVKACFHLNFSDISEGNNGREHAWAMYPYRGQLSSEAFSLGRPLTKGKYHVVRHVESCDSTVLGNDPCATRHVLNQCCSRVHQAIAMPPEGYRPMIVQPPPEYELSHDGNWEGTTRAHGKIPPSLRGAEEAVQGFHSLSNTSGRCCAISGLGRYTPEKSTLAWSDPGLTISHIIPPQHFDVYPVDKSDMDWEDDDLAEKWRVTWDPRENGIVLLSHFHALWKARLVAIEPSTLTVRCFGPYDSISAYDGRKAHLYNVPSRDALRWHYDMCVYENITAKQHPRSLAVKKRSETTAAKRPTLSASRTKTGPAPFAASEALPFALPPPGQPRKRPRADQDDATSLRLADSMDSKDNLARPLCTLACIIRLGDPAKSDPSCPNFSRHRRLGFGATVTAVHKLDIASLSSRGLLRDEDVPASQLARENTVSEYEITSRGSNPVLKVVLPHGYTVVGKGVVRTDHSDLTAAQDGGKENALDPLVEADILVRLGPQLAGECVPFCLGIVKLGGQLRDPSCDGPIQRVMLLASAGVPLSNASVPRHGIQDEIRRTVRDIRNRGVTLREPLTDDDLRWNQEAQRVMVVNFAGAKVEAAKEYNHGSFASPEFGMGSCAGA